LLLFLLLSGYWATAAQAQGVFIRTGDMNAARAFHTATLFASDVHTADVRSAYSTLLFAP